MNDTRDFLDGWNRKIKTLWCWSQFYVWFKTAQAKGRLLSNEKQKKFWDEKHSYFAEMLWSNITELRGWWVKVGQFLSTRSDVLPAQYITYLTRLQDMMPYSSFSVIKPLIENELGCSIDTVFSEFEEQAFASASIGQVHRAKLRENNQDVVVKVQHPEVEKTLPQDMLTLAQMSWALGVVEKGFNVFPILEEWQKSAADELDFRIELSHQQRASKAVKESGIHVIVPNCYPHLTTKRIMVMDFCPGFKITEVEKLKEFNVDQDKLMYTICSFFAYQIHIDGMLNGDPHPGNILVNIDSETNEATPVLLDWGLVKTFSLEQRIAFSKAVYSIANVDIMGLNTAVNEMGFRFKTGSFLDPETYINVLRLLLFHSSKQQLLDDIKEMPGGNSNTSQTNYLENNPLDDWPKDLIFLVRVASLLHGLCLQINANVPFLKIFIEKAETCLLSRYPPCCGVSQYQYPPFRKGRVRSDFEWQLYQLLQKLQKEKRILGCQVAIFKEGSVMADLAIGYMGLVDTRPVERSTLFPLMMGVNGILATAVLKLIDVTLRETDSDISHHRKNQPGLRLTDPICDWWDGFIRFGKEHITVYDALTHRSGLHGALPEHLTLSDIMNYDTMISYLEDAIKDQFYVLLQHPMTKLCLIFLHYFQAPKEPYKLHGGRYAYLTSSWLFSEIVRGVTGESVDQFIMNHFVDRLGLKNEFFLCLPKCCVEASLNEKASLNQDDSKSKVDNSFRTFIKKEDYFCHKGKNKNDFQTQTFSFIKDKKQQFVSFFESKTKDLENSINLKKNSIKHSKDLPKKKVKHNKMNKKHSCNIFNRFALMSRKLDLESFLLPYLKKSLGSIDSGSSDEYATPMSPANGFPLPFASKYLEKAIEASQKIDTENPKQVTPLELFTTKPYILDPLLYDGETIQNQFIPSVTCRVTARGLAYFYACLASGALIHSSLIKLACEISTIDDSLDSFILTAGGSRLFGLGYQLYPCFNKKQSTLPQYDETKTHSLLNFPNYQSFTSLTNKEKEKEEKNIKTLKKLNSTKKIQDEGYPIVQGLGHGDFGGSIGLCFPEKKLSIAILVNDMLTGSEASKTILNFILNYFGLVPCWETPYTMQSFITDMKSIIPTTFEAPPDEILATVDILTHQCTSNKT